MMAHLSMVAMTTVENDQHPTLSELLAQYGYLLRQPNGYRYLSGYIRGAEYMAHARQVIEAKYPPTVQALYVVEQPRERRQRRSVSRAA